MTLLVWLAASLAGLLTVHCAINSWLLRRPPADPPAVDVPVSVLLPLRDEADRLQPCLESLLAQRGVPDMEIIALDDGSTDGTGDLVLAISDQHGHGSTAGYPTGGNPTGGSRAGGSRVRLVTGEAPPPGWLGKPYACHQLSRYARPDAKVLVFVDADVVLAPDAVAGAVAMLTGYHLISPYPRMIAVTPGERLIQPLLAWSWLTFLPLRAMERARHPALAAAGGQFLVVNRAGYDRAGGHAAARGSVLEDVEVARNVKRAGGRIGLVGGASLATCRMYRSWREVRDGYGKSLWAAFGSPFGAAAVVLLLLLAYLVPPALVWFDPLAGCAGYLAGVLGRAVAGRVTGSRVWPDALLHPVSVMLFGVLTADSYLRRRAGRLSWRGRTVEVTGAR